MQFDLWRLILAVLFLGMAFGLVRIGWLGTFPVLCFVAALALVTVSICLLFRRRARAFLEGLLEFIAHALSMLWP